MYPDGRMNAKNAARYLGLEEKTLAMKRSDGTGPCFIKRGRIFYFKEDLDAWINECSRARSTAQLRAATSGSHISTN
ncbi:MAG: DNA-binding protein [Candidatus Electrothrix sp. AR1]|nr:DNA-binding protein [Candidatus Electrothrix sp. AR1]